MLQAILVSAAGLGCASSFAEDSLAGGESYFDYPYEQVVEYYVIEAWRRLDEPVPAYTPEMVARHTGLVGKLPWVMPTASGDEQMVLGHTPGWPKNPDRSGSTESCADIR